MKLTSLVDGEGWSQGLNRRNYCGYLTWFQLKMVSEEADRRCIVQKIRRRVFCQWVWMFTAISLRHMGKMCLKGPQGGGLGYFQCVQTQWDSVPLKTHANLGPITNISFTLQYTKGVPLLQCGCQCLSNSLTLTEHLMFLGCFHHRSLGHLLASS